MRFLPKTDSHAEDIITVVHEEFEKKNNRKKRCPIKKK
jgi:hypothetical protein